MLPERIEWAIDVLEQVKVMHKPFDINDWFRSNYNDCNTAACALGWLCRDPRFKAVGLSVRTIIGVGSVPIIQGYQEDTNGWTHTGVEAGVIVLGISRKKAEWIFYPSTYINPDNTIIEKVTPLMVIARLKLLLEHNDKWYPRLEDYTVREEG